jgi:hypothetical protein
MQKQHLATLAEEWVKIREAVRDWPNSPVTGDPRHDARAFMFEMIVRNEQYDSGRSAAMTGSAIIWLARTSPVGVAVGESHKRVHYEITDTDRPGVRNYRLMLS